MRLCQCWIRMPSSSPPIKLFQKKLREATGAKQPEQLVSYFFGKNPTITSLKTAPSCYHHPTLNWPLKPNFSWLLSCSRQIWLVTIYKMWRHKQKYINSGSCNVNCLSWLTRLWEIYRRVFLWGDSFMWKLGKTTDTNQWRLSWRGIFCSANC